MELLLRNRASVNQAKFFRAPCRKNYTLDRKVMNIFSWARRALSPRKVWGRSHYARRLYRRENVVFVFFTDRMPRSDKLPVLNLLTGQQSGFSPRRGDSLHRFMPNWAGPTGSCVRLAVQNFTSITPGEWECGPQNIKNFHFLVKSCPVDRFRKFLEAYIRPTILHQCFKFHMITGYGVIAEKPRVGKLSQIFPCTLQEKLCVVSKTNDTFYDGHDELYRHAKFGEDRTMSAGCRCENVFCHAPCPDHRAFEGCIVRTNFALPFIARFRLGLQRFFSRSL